MAKILSWQGNFDYRKSALDYATLGRALKTVFISKMFFCLFIDMMIMKNTSW